MRFSSLLLALALVPVTACSLLLDFPPIGERASSGGGPEGGGGAAGHGGDGRGGGDGGSGGAGGAMCAAPCNETCGTPDRLALLSPPNPASGAAPDLVSADGLAAIGDNIVASGVFKPGIQSACTGTTVDASGYLARLPKDEADAAEIVLKAVECHLPNGYFSGGPVASDGTRLHSVATTPAPAGSMDTLLGYTTEPFADACKDDTFPGHGDQSGGLVAYLASGAPHEAPSVVAAWGAAPADGAHAMTLGVAARQDTEDDKRYVAIAGIAATDIFGATGSGEGRYFAALFDADSQELIWSRVLPRRAGGAFPTGGTAGSVAIDDENGVWVTGALAGPPEHLFVWHIPRSAQTDALFEASGISTGRSVASAGGRVYVGGDFEGTLEAGTHTLVASGMKDALVLSFDATTFDAAPAPSWTYPAEGEKAKHQTAFEDLVRDVGVLDAPNCAPAVYFTGCVARKGGACSEIEGTSVLLGRLDGETGIPVWSRTLETTEGAWVGRAVLPTPAGLWFGADLKGAALGRKGPTFTNDVSAFATSALYARVPL